MKNIFLLLILFPLFSIAQTHTINDYLIEMNGTTNDNDLSANTYYNAIDNCDISWNIIKDSMPLGWEFSICFPDCYPIGITNSQNIFSANENTYLNCHMYHNGYPGYGIIKMQITTNNQFSDTITWTGTVDLFTSINNISSNKNKKIVNVINIVGKQTKIRQNSFLIYVYDDGTFEKKIFID